MSAKEKDTKDRILQIASHLFATHGFNGTSIRDIANSADVNVASINYHFKNKVGLLGEVFKFNYQWLDENISRIAQEEELNIYELSEKIFDFFLNNPVPLINTFKTFFIEDLKNTDFVCHMNQKQFGPPGQLAILEHIGKEVNLNLTHDSKFWAMKTIFAYLIHHGIILSAPHVKQAIETSYPDPNLHKKHLKHHVKATLEYLTNHHNEF